MTDCIVKNTQVLQSVEKQLQLANNYQQDCSYQGEALNVPTAFKVYGAAVITLKN